MDRDRLRKACAEDAGCHIICIGHLDENNKPVLETYDTDGNLVIIEVDGDQYRFQKPDLLFVSDWMNLEEGPYATAVCGLEVRNG
jgi:hypothetical protein